MSNIYWHRKVVGATGYKVEKERERKGAHCSKVSEFWIECKTPIANGQRATITTIK